MGEACLDNGIYRVAFLPSLSSAQMEHRGFPWYTLKVRSGGEPTAVAALRHRGFAPYCPMRKERRRYSDRMKIVDTAVFSGYVFCQFDLLKKLPIISSPGVEYIVGFADAPEPIPEEQLLNIWRMIEAGAQATRALAPGQRVRVIHGPLEGVEGILVRDATGNRLVVSIELLKQGAFLYIDEDEVRPVGPMNRKGASEILNGCAIQR